MSIDDSDMKILHELAKDSRLSFRAIGKKLGLATTTVIHRYEKMKKDGVIKYPSAIIDHEKLGYNIVAMIELVVSKGKLVDDEERIAKKHNVYAVYDITGDMDAVILARFKDRKELNDFVKSLLATEFVERTNTHLVLNVVKEDLNATI